jgi:EAL domain-containing protein (putative c-di-GMP-specific phosphodiesterase class I)
MPAAANRLLIVDDEIDIAALIGRIAAGCGYEVKTCNDVEGLLAQLPVFRPTHIVLDLIMPGLDGIQALRRLADARIRARIVLMSGLESRVLDAARRVGLESGLDIAAILTKPFTNQELRRLFDGLKEDTSWLNLVALRQAMERGELVLQYQPRLHLPSRSPAGVEALVRWAHPERGLILPDAFLPLIEADPLIDALTDYVLEAVLAQVTAWQGVGHTSTVSINLAPRNLRDPDLADRLAAQCQRAQVPASQLTLELTESAAMEIGPGAIDVLTRLRLKGFELSIDDFGTGYSSLVQLHRLPFCEIKVDKTFVGECDSSRDAIVIVRAIIDLAHNLGLRACAEGVESEATLTILEQLGCDRLQGFYIGHPMPGDEVPRWRGVLAMPSRKRAG